MGLLSQATSHIPDVSNVPRGTYRLVCAKIEEKPASTGRDMVSTQWDIADHPASFPVYHNILGVKPDDSEKTAQAMLSNLKQLKLGIGIGADDELEADQLVGCEAYAFLVEEDRGNGPRNKISYFITPQAPADGMGVEPETTDPGDIPA